MIGINRAHLAVLAVLGLTPACATAQEPSVAERAANQIVAVERAFAIDADAIGIVPAFRKRVGPDAILFLPDPTVINPMLETASWPGNLDWRPELVVVSKAGDLAFTSGPSAWTVGEAIDSGYYFSIWKRQPDGEWRFAVDGTTAMAENLYSRPVAETETILPAASSGAPGDIRALEAALASEAAKDYRAALTSRLDPRARVVRANSIPAVGAGAGAALVAAQPATVMLRLIDGGVSASGDLAYAYGEVRWTSDGASRRGYFNRLWRRDEMGTWRVLYDQMNVRPES